jgi:hypothetical protein
MKKPKKITGTNKPGQERNYLSRADKIALIREVRQLLESLDYVSIGVFGEAIKQIVNSFVLGRNTVASGPTCDEALHQIIQFAKRSTTPEGQWLSRWIKKLKTTTPEREPQQRVIPKLIQSLFPRMAQEIPDFGWIHTSEEGPEIFVGSNSGFFHVYADEHQLRKFALQLIESANDIQASRELITPTRIPEDYEQTALEDISDQINADSWLYRPPDES